MSDASQAPLRRANGHGHLRDIVYGAIDGSVTTFAIVAGVAGAGLSPFVILALGFANVLADGFSMAAGNYSGTKAELDDLNRLRRLETARLARDPEGTRAELRGILAAKGLSDGILDRAADEIAGDPPQALALILDGSYGLSSVDPHPMKAALATFAAFLVAGMVPLLPFLLSFPSAFEVATLLTLTTFFAIGAYKSRWSLSPWWRSGLETLLIGGVAAGIAYAVGSLFSL
ncbi:VIT1/CCC1 transporter family protein [Salipiger sp. P9]|uniref:VIT1/CCC1 transporter family protein n=1 Tax=Salipiger pentaromativorans TaxID=2943193 RepID=UPI002157C5CB|nr:VIT1/CCC1 transporter family protein [Salipiger pentaromativorans]MCR8550383.1 VIT1/CCC1 transporter family protein [Salipiger pentaromativorans]